MVGAFVDVVCMYVRVKVCRFVIFVFLENRAASVAAMCFVSFAFYAGERASRVTGVFANSCQCRRFIKSFGFCALTVWMYVHRSRAPSYSDSIDFNYRIDRVWASKSQSESIKCKTSRSLNDFFFCSDRT